MKIYSKIMISLLLAYIPLTIAMEQTETNYIPPVHIGNILNTTNHTLTLEIEHKVIATISPRASEYVSIELPLSKGRISGLNSPEINVLHNKANLLKGSFKRSILPGNDYMGSISWKAVSDQEHKLVSAYKHFNPGQKDSYEINITFAGNQLEGTEFEIVQTVK